LSSEEERMKRSLSRLAALGATAACAVLPFACSSEPGDDAESNLGSVEQAARKCGNGICSNGETCSSCPTDCGSCGGGSGGSGGSSGSAGTAGSAGAAGTSGICGSTAAPPATYQHIVVFSFENRTWSNVGLGFSAITMPYLHSLATQCSYFSDWTETNTSQNSLTQYIGETSGVNNTATVNDCTPSTSCRSNDNNIFRQVRLAGGTARSYVEGATTGCSASGNAAKHIPALYYFGTYTDGTGSHSDHDFCTTEVRPYSELDVDNLPTYAFITPTQCNDGHDCSDATVDAWASVNIQRVLDSAAYKSGNTAVFVWYDEDHPVPNLQIAPTSRAGQITQTGIGSHAAMLKTIEAMLGLPVMNQGQLPAAADFRSLEGI
jgi:phosphatidylinositol-3-phosphatase